MKTVKRGVIIDVNLDPIQGAEKGKIRPCLIVTNDIYNERVPVVQVIPITAWSPKKAKIKTNVELLPSAENGLSKKSVADCLQTRPIDWKHRFVKQRGKLESIKMEEIDQALKYVFELK